MLRIERLEQELSRAECGIEFNEDKSSLEGSMPNHGWIRATLEDGIIHIDVWNEYVLIYGDNPPKPNWTRRYMADVDARDIVDDVLNRCVMCGRPRHVFHYADDCECAPLDYDPDDEYYRIED